MEPELTGGHEARGRRLFVAVELDDAGQDAIDTALEPWRAVFPRARWTPRANRHVTVRFLGTVVPRLDADVRAAVAATAAAGAPFELALAGAGRFPERGRSKVLWVGLRDPAGALPGLAAALQARLPVELSAPTRPFAAHLTVARSEPPLEVPATWSDTVVAPVRWRVDHVTLFQSHLERPHARYEPVARCALAHVAGPPADPR